ncbi:MAG: RnfABCDGE type electron transport complex subunit D [Flavobacteriales bacterium]|nr:RnfABCDGE type electron transport complex subunit D [Flavobacteriales bacterium]
MRAAIRFFRHDARHFQILFLASFLLYGIGVLQWDAEVRRYLLLFGTCLLVQAAFIHWKRLPWHSIKSAMVTGLGMSLLLKSGSPWTLVLGAAVAIASKFLLRVEGKHIFNPGNLGIAAAVLLTGDAWVSPGQWGSGAALVFLVGAAGCMVVLRVGRIDTSIAFLATFGALDFVRQVLYLGWEPEVWLHRMSNGSLLLFTFFMITDPVTTPRAQGARIGWSMAIAVLAFVLGWKWWVNATPIWALLIVSAITPVLDRIWKGERFQWIKNQAPRNSPCRTSQRISSPVQLQHSTPR